MAVLSQQYAEKYLLFLQFFPLSDVYSSLKHHTPYAESFHLHIKEPLFLPLFGLVKEYLAEDGVFIFDLNTVHKYRDLMGECTISENREESSFIWENYFYEDEMVNEYDLTLFIREESDLYRKYEELHYQKAYELEQVKELLLQAGMEFVAAYDAFTHDPVTAESERMYIIARPKVI